LPREFFLFVYRQLSLYFFSHSKADEFTQHLAHRYQPSIVHLQFGHISKDEKHFLCCFYINLKENLLRHFLVVK
jgi:hypothetical protein